MSKLKDLREAKGLSQSKLAAASGVTLRMIQQWEQGVKDINVTKLSKLAALSIALECSISDLLTDDDLIEMLKEVTL